MDRRAVKPPFAYFGGKTTLAEQIADLLPPHQHYVEPFAGSLAVLLAKPAARWETVNDLDADLVTFWRVLRDEPEALARAATLTPHSRSEFQASCDLEASDDLERARRVWVRLTQSRSNSMKPTGWRYRQDPGMGTSLPDYLAAYAQRMQSVAKRLHNVSLECRGAIEVIQDYGRHAEVCLYVDPPYLGTTRAANYRHELLADSEHEALADALNAARGPVILSGYGSPLYESLFGDWHRVSIKAPTTMSQATDRVEVLWSNRPIGEPDLFGGAA